MNAITEILNVWGVRFVGFALPMLVQSAMLMALLFALDFCLRKRIRATIRYAVWMLALVKLTLSPSLASPTGAGYWLRAERVNPPLVSAAETAKMIASVNYKRTDGIRGIAPVGTGSPLGWQAIVFVVWLLVAAMVAMWVVWRLRDIVGVVRQSTEAPEELRALLESCRREMRVKHSLEVRCADIGSPAICGVWRPLVLTPTGLANNLSRVEMRSVLLHELAHHKRGDLWVNHAQIFLQIIYWYNPILWLANASIRRVREQAVDEMVLVEMGAEAQTYPATLLRVAKLGLGQPLAAVGLMGIMERGQGLTQRILHIMDRPLPRTARIGPRGLVAVFSLALVVLPMARRSGAEPALQTSAAENQMPDETLSLTVNPELFIRNIKAHANETMNTASNHWSDALLDMLRIQGVVSGPNRDIRLNTKTGEITTRNTPAALAIFRRTVEELNQPDGKCDFFSRVPGQQTILFNAVFYQLPSSDFAQLGLGPPTVKATRDHSGWWTLDPNQLRQIKLNLQASGIKPFSSPRIETGYGISADLSVGGPSNNLELECLPIAPVENTGEKKQTMDFKITARTTGIFSGHRAGDWPDFANRTNCALFAEAYIEDGGALAFHAKNSGNEDLILLLDAVLKAKK